MASRSASCTLLTLLRPAFLRFFIVAAQKAVWPSRRTVPANTGMRSGLRRLASIAGVLQQLHETEILVQLHVAVKKRQPGIIRDKTDRGRIAPADADHVFHQSGHRL